MALLKCFKAARAQDGATVTQDAGGRGPKTVSVQETWTLLYDGIVDQSVARNAPGLPVVGLVYGGLFCTRVNPRRSTETPYKWDVTVDYQNQQQQDGGDGGNVWNLNITKSTAGREETRLYDRLGKFLVNAFGDMLPQMPNVTLYDDVYSITWSTSVAPTWDQIEGKTNSDAFSFTICGVTRSFTKSQAKCTAAGFASEKIITDTDGGTSQRKFIYNCQITIQIRKPKWRWSSPNEGWNGFIEELGPGRWGQFTTIDESGNRTPKTSPTALDLEGFPLDQGAQILKLPDDAIGQAIPNGSRDYPEDGAFELEDQIAFTPLFSNLRD